MERISCREGTLFHKVCYSNLRNCQFSFPPGIFLTFENKTRNLGICQFSFSTGIFYFANKTRTLRLYRPPPSSPDQTVLCRGSQIQYDSSEQKIFITSTFLCQGRRESLGPRGPLVLPLVDPPSRKKKPDHFYTGVYAIRIAHISHHHTTGGGVLFTSWCNF